MNFNIDHDCRIQNIELVQKKIFWKLKEGWKEKDIQLKW